MMLKKDVWNAFYWVIGTLSLAVATLLIVNQGPFPFWDWFLIFLNLANGVRCYAVAASKSK